MKPVLNYPPGLGLKAWELFCVTGHSNTGICGSMYIIKACALKCIDDHNYTEIFSQVDRKKKNGHCHAWQIAATMAPVVQ